MSRPRTAPDTPGLKAQHALPHMIWWIKYASDERLHEVVNRANVAGTGFTRLDT